MTGTEGLPADAKLAALRLPLAGEGLEELVLTLTLEGGQTEHLAAAEVEGDPLHRTDTKVLDFQDGDGLAGRDRLRGDLVLGELGRPGFGASRFGAQHDLDDPCLPAFLRNHRAYLPAVSEDGGAIAGSDHLR